MGTERLSMRKTREILRQKWVLGCSHREVARSVGVSFGAVATAVGRATAAGLDWAAVEGLSECNLEERLYGGRGGTGAERPRPDCVYLHTERKKPGVTLELLHLEYLARHPDGYRYTQFCEIYRQWLKRRRLSMRQIHRAGEKMFVDYAGKKPHLVDPATGAEIAVELFVAVLGASNCTYAEATWTQQVPDFLASHTRACEYFGGVAGAVVPDQLRSGVTAPCRYEPGLQRSYAEWAAHYGTVVLPARLGRPRDKATAEVAVQIVERWILARLRHERFFTLEALNARIRELLVELNDRLMRRYGVSRRVLFERLERAALRPLPPEPFVIGEWRGARVNIDYHVAVDHHFYSVPFSLVHEEVDVRLTAGTVEIFLRGQRVAAHARSYRRGGFTTIPAHMPKAHRQHLTWTPSRLIHWAGTIGPHTAALVQAILADRPHPEQGYRSCLGILRLARLYGPRRLEAACARGGVVRARSYRHIQSILKHGLDRVAWSGTTRTAHAPLAHPNIRGGGYYQ